MGSTCHAYAANSSSHIVPLGCHGCGTHMSSSAENRVLCSLRGCFDHEVKSQQFQDTTVFAPICLVALAVLFR